MITINFTKWADFFFIVASSFIVAMAGNYFFQWSFQFGLIIGICLGVWNSLYDLGVTIISIMAGDDEEEDEKSVRHIPPEEGPPEI